MIAWLEAEIVELRGLILIPGLKSNFEIVSSVKERETGRWKLMLTTKI